MALRLRKEEKQINALFQDFSSEDERLIEKELSLSHDFVLGSTKLHLNQIKQTFQVYVTYAREDMTFEELIISEVSPSDPRRGGSSTPR